MKDFIVSMIKKIIYFIKYKVKKSQLILFISGLFFILIGFLSWNLFFSKYYIFSEQEKEFTKAVKEYFEYHPIYLPKDGLIKTITLEELFITNQIKELNIPKTNKLCDLNSWVKVFNDKGVYKYKTYLKCGKYESSVDSIGPVITLNGDSTVYVHLNHQYEELGVSKVVDNNDGNIDVNKVKIDSSKVNTKKVGKYKVTYSVMDKLNNETKVTRTVIVARNLTELVIENTDESNYYKGTSINNYILFSGMMYRIINANSDGTITLISSENLNNLRINTTEYENSNIDKYLSNDYLNIIHDKDYIVERDYCVGNISSVSDTSNSCSKTIKRKVSLLSADMLMNTISNNSSFLCNNIINTLSNFVGEKATVSYRTMGSSSCITDIEINSMTVIRPVITLKSNIIIMSGDGSHKNPYKLNDYNYAKQQDKITTRLIGEYVNYSGNTYRIIKQNKKSTTLIATTGLVKNDLSNNRKDYLTLVIPEEQKYSFDINKKDNPGYIINNSYIDYINDNYIIKTEYTIPTNEIGKLYNEYSLDKFEAKISLPKTYDLFSSVQSNDGGYMYLYIDKSLNDYMAFNINVINGRVFEDKINAYGEYCFKPVITINGDLTIKSGKGTINSPYYINK